jgi:transposase, IS30 family
MHPSSAKKRDTSMSYQHLSQEERYRIAALSKSRYSLSAIARDLGRPKSTISREFGRNRSTHDNVYRAEVAHGYATARRRRERRGPHFSAEQWALVLKMLEHKFSPEQISNTIRMYCDFSISYETIYKYILFDKRKGGCIYKNLRIMPKRRRKRYNSYDSRGILRGKRSISDRPQNVESRQEIGHWEGDTVIGKDRHHCIVTLVERATGFLIIKKVPARTASEVTKACISAITEHKQSFISITFDNGTEFHSYKEIEAAHQITCYFAAPYHSWERGTNENTNGLIRQYIPKRTCMRHLTQKDCDRIAYSLNTRPRKRYGYKTPEQLYYGRDTSLHLLLEPRLGSHYSYSNKDRPTGHYCYSDSRRDLILDSP